MIYINFCSKFPRAKVALALSRERRAVMKTVTAVTPEPDEPDDLDTKAVRVLRYAYRKRTKAEKRGNAPVAAFWTGFHRSFARRWYRH